MKKAICASALFLASSALGAIPAYAADGDGPWQIRVRALVVAPTDNDSIITPIGGNTDHTTQVVPELDISYFFTENLSAELILGVTKHNGTAVGTSLGDVDIGSTWLLPPTVTMQYHFAPDAMVNPYVGAGVNYTIFFSEKLPDGSALVDVDHGDAFGVALQAGVDITPNPDSEWFWNLDVKKVWMNTQTTVDAGALGIVSGDVNLDPWLIGVGVGKRF